MAISDFEIEKYFDGDLTDEQKIAFEEKMQSDALFAREVREHQQVRRDLNAQGERLSLIEQMEEIHHKEYGGIPYLKAEKQSKTEKKEEKKAKKEEIDEKKASPVVKDISPKSQEPEPVKERKVVTLRMFYMGVGIAAALAAIFTLGGVFLNQNQNGDLMSKTGYEDLMMEEGSDDSVRDGYSDGASNPRVEPIPSTSKKFTATAFAIAKDGYFITNNHVVKGSKRLKLKMIDENKSWTSFNAEVVLHDEFSDLALVKIKDTLFKELGILPFTFSEKPSGIGEEIFTLGYPKKDIVMEPGIISSTSGMKGDTTAYQLAMSLNSGNSGGPIFNDKGEVVAVVKGKHNGKEGTGYAVRSDYLWNLIEKYESENSVTIKKPKWNQLKGKKRIRMIKHIQQFVFMVEAEK